METFVATFVILAAVGAAYLLPTLVAALRDHHNTGMIAVLNFFLGWTFLGWVISLAMACGEVHKVITPSPMSGGSVPRKRWRRSRSG